jgi:hypothetical protein
VSAPDLDALYAEAELEATDAFMQRRFGLEPVNDLSGVFTGQSSLAPAPTSEPPASELTAPTTPVLHQGPRGAASSDDAQFEAYMRRYFPAAAKPR